MSDTESDSDGLDPQSRELLRRLDFWGELSTRTVDQARALERRRFIEFGGSATAPACSTQIGTVSTPTGEHNVVIYRPEAPAPIGVLVWLHGGGWVLGSPALSDDQARGLAAASKCLVVSVDYRLAPENPFPAGLEDCYAVVSWVADQTERLGVPSNRLAVGGDSAGGNLAAAVTLLARDRGGPKIDFQALIYPALCHQLETQSRRLYRTGYWLTLDTMQWCSRLYVKDAADLNNPYASPFLAQSLVDLPPAFILTAECDILRDEAELYGDRLQSAGVATQVIRYQGMLHGFMGCAGIVSRAWDAMAAAGEAIKNALVGL